MISKAAGSSGEQLAFPGDPDRGAAGLERSSSGPGLGVLQQFHGFQGQADPGHRGVQFAQQAQQEAPAAVAGALAQAGAGQEQRAHGPGAVAPAAGHGGGRDGPDRGRGPPGGPATSMRQAAPSSRSRAGRPRRSRKRWTLWWSIGSPPSRIRRGMAGMRLQGPADLPQGLGDRDFEELQGQDIHEWSLGPLDRAAAESFKQWLARAALAQGFARVGFASCEPFHAERARLEAWFAQEGAALLPYLRPEALLDPARVMPGAATALVGFFPYARPEAVPGAAPDSLKLSRYLWGPDYHRILKPRLKALLAKAQELEPGLRGRVCVDTAPLMERQLAARAGLGWQGKHTLLIALARGQGRLLGLPGRAPAGPGAASRPPRRRTLRPSAPGAWRPAPPEPWRRSGSTPACA